MNQGNALLCMYGSRSGIEKGDLGEEERRGGGEQGRKP